MLLRLAELAAARTSFGFETTLATRSFAPWLAGLRESGYKVHLVFLWLPSAEAAVARVAERMRNGGHDVPESTIRRRYDAGLKNFLRLYMPLADTWQLADNSVAWLPHRIALGGNDGPAYVYDPVIWQAIKERAPGT